MTLDEVLSAAVTRANAARVSGVNAEHLTDPDLRILCTATHAEFLWPRCRKESSRRSGWGYYSPSSPGLRRWWGLQARLAEIDAQRLRPLRRQVYDLLEEYGVIEKEAPTRNPCLHVAPPQVRTIGTSNVISGAAFGDAATNYLVERAAMQYVGDYYRSGGWQVEDVSELKCGWDLEARRGQARRCIEVKGVSNPDPTVLLTRNEHSKARTQKDWRLAVVTRARSDDEPAMMQFSAEDVVAVAEPYVYQVRLQRS